MAFTLGVLTPTQGTDQCTTSKPFYASSESFPTVEAAVAYARSKCFEATILKGGVQTGEVVASWSPIGGFREYAR